MEIRQLEYFLAVAEEGGFTRGARRLRVAQSAVSATVQKLERELGMPLFSRNGQSISLTEAGTALLPEAQGLLTAARRARDTVDQVRGGMRGTVRIGTLASIGMRPAADGLLVVDLPAVLGRFHVTHPLVTFRLNVAPRGSADHFQALADGRLDLAMVAVTDQTPAARVRPLGSVRWSLICPARHRLAGATSVTLDDLADEKFVDFPHGWGSRTLIDRAFAGAGIARDVPFEAADQASALGLVRNGLGVTFLPRAGSEGEGVSVVDVADADLDLRVGLAIAQQREPSAATSALADAIVRAAARTRR
ncbi:LysR family transcriptional regulator [Micromonospora ureilytica]|uniref:LysR family transcriptional regulator n=1 Tax=Micromonospora ureilytica TaxID=709868 RepID=UPI00340489DE